jgi:hypothetical protein
MAINITGPLILVRRGGRMVPIEQKDWTEEDKASKLGQNHPLDPTKRLS